jgi:hypothetical protein
VKYVPWNLRNYLLEQEAVVVKQLICTREVVGLNLGQVCQFLHANSGVVLPLYGIPSHLIVDVM